jgi:hypothetical protein
MKTRLLLISGLLFGMMCAVLMTIHIPSYAVAYAQADVDITPERTLTPSAPLSQISQPFSADVQNETLYDEFVSADNPDGLVLLAGKNLQQEYLSAPFVVPLTNVAPVLDVALVFELTQETYNNDAVKIAIRGSVDGEAWGEWQIQDHFHFDVVGMYSHLVSFDKTTRYVQFRIVWDETQLTEPITMTLVKINFISAGETPPNVIADIQRSASMGQSISLPNSAPQPVVSRTGWGCPVGQNAPDWSPQYTNITHFIVHHTVSANSGLDWAAHVRSIWNYHTNSLGWGDIGYNYLIDPNGVIYEGRAGGDGSIGAHFSCMNSRTMGIALIGTFTSVNPSNAAMNSLKNLLAWKATTLNINPQTISYHNPSALNMWTISGHRDGNTSAFGCPGGTSCPGDVLYGLLPSVRADVVQLMVTSTPTPTRTPTPTITPTPTNTPTPSNTPTNYVEWEIFPNEILNQLWAQNNPTAGYTLVVYGQRQIHFYVDYEGRTYIVPIAIRRTVVDFVEMLIMPILAVDNAPVDEFVSQYLGGIVTADFARALDDLLNGHYGVTIYNVEDILIGDNRLRVGVLIGG